MRQGMDTDRDTVSLTYDDLANALGIDVQSARRRALRSKWPKTRGNDGRARVHVPVTVLPAATETGATKNVPVVPAQATVAGLVAATPESLSHLMSQVAELAEVRQRLGHAEGEAVAFREALSHERVQAAAERRRAEALQVERDRVQAELSAWTAGGPLARAWRAFMNRRGG